MASTITLAGDWMQSVGNVRQTIGTGNLGNPYASGGIAVSAAQVGLGVILDLDVQPAGGYVFEYVKSTGKVKAYDNKDPAAAGGADLALPEVGAIDLSTILFNFVATGR